MTTERHKNPAPSEAELLYLPPPSASSGQVERSIPTRLPYGFVPTTKPRDLKSFMNFLVGNPYFFVPLAGLGGVLFSLVTSLARLKDKFMAPEGSEKRMILDRRFMQRMDLMVKFKVFTVGTGALCLLYYEIFVKKPMKKVTSKNSE